MTGMLLLHRLSEFVAQRDMVEAAVGRRQVDEALLNFVKKIRGVDLNFDAMEEKLAAKLAKSIADGDAIDEVVIDDDDFAPPNSLKRLVLPGSPSRRDGVVRIRRRALETRFMLPTSKLRAGDEVAVFRSSDELRAVRGACSRLNEWVISPCF
ncbi:unnamed protein product [Microthlaspi erraticum]|uniref:Uncharacterized protein n=1 Tax=Microthlaspi erraticum TaxID=1685480 RepID=A0A6D2J8P4_9BRAS|nr:unnamed protein product [Microthlaspi erraticum]